MCICRPRNILQKYCGKKVKLPSETKLEKFTYCAHPAWLAQKSKEVSNPGLKLGAPYRDAGVQHPSIPSTVNKKNGSWLTQHAEEHAPRKKTPHDSRIISKFFGCSFSQLTDLSMRLRQAADGKSVSLSVPFNLDVLANQAHLSHLPGAAAINNKRADAAKHYPMISSKCDGARRALEHVGEQLQSTQPPAELRRLAAIVDHANGILLQAFEAMVNPTVDSHVMAPGASPLPPGEPA